MKEEEVTQLEEERLEGEANTDGENFVAVKAPKGKEAYKVAIGKSCLRSAQQFTKLTFISSQYRNVNSPPPHSLDLRLNRSIWEGLR